MKKYPLADKNISTDLIKRKNNTYLEYFKNPNLSHINTNSHFIYDESSALDHYNKIQNKNLIKLTQEEEGLLMQIIKEINIEKIMNNNEELISVPFDIFEKIKNFKPLVKHDNEDLVEFIKKSIQNTKNREKISCRKLAILYEKNYGKKIGKTTVHNILRKKLGYKFLKTTYKTNRLKSRISILHCFYFIKCFVKCLKLDFTLIFLDESKIELTNSHLKCWRKPEETILFGDNIKAKKNLLLAIGKSSVFEYQLISENTNGSVFFNFIINLKKKLDCMKINKFVLIMDNCSSHKTEEVLKYFESNKINVLFTPAYMSIFNPIELIFRGIKKMTYNKLYNTFDEVENDVLNYLKNDRVEKTLLYNYKESLEQFLFYTKSNINQNLNSFEF